MTSQSSFRWLKELLFQFNLSVIPSSTTEAHTLFSVWLVQYGAGGMEELEVTLLYVAWNI